MRLCRSRTGRRGDTRKASLSGGRIMMTFAGPKPRNRLPKLRLPELRWTFQPSTRLPRFPSYCQRFGPWDSSKSRYACYNPMASLLRRLCTYLAPTSHEVCSQASRCGVWKPPLQGSRLKRLRYLNAPHLPYVYPASLVAEWRTTVRLSLDDSGLSRPGPLLVPWCLRQARLECRIECPPAARFICN
jgi:hypothetical protein